MMLTYAYAITQTLLAIGILCAVYRVYRGPSVLDRVISVDVILIIVASVMLTDMAYREHQDFILFVVITAVIGFLGAVAIARYVVVRRPDGVGEAALVNQARQKPLASAAEPATTPGEPEAPAEAPIASSADPAVPADAAVREAEPDESTSWFTALTRSGFRPQRDPGHREQDQDRGAPDDDHGAADQDNSQGGRG